MKNSVGRPDKINEHILSLLEEAFKWGANDVEACFSAGISPATLYRYQSENEEFKERKDALKRYPVLLAKKAVIDGFKDDPNLALKYLERRARDEFSTRTEVLQDNEIHFRFISSTLDEIEEGDRETSEKTKLLDNSTENPKVEDVKNQDYL